jgi:pimeloyl-ACP methyl ester carboxylesterase
MPTFVAADGAELTYSDMGPGGGIPLLFLHGWNGARALWFPVMELLTTRHRTIAPDLRGFGASNTAPGPYRVETFADDLSAMIAELDLDPLVVIGHSMGAAVAQRFAIDRPDAVEGLVLVSPVPAGGVAFPPNIDAFFRSIPGSSENANLWLSKLTYREPTREIRNLLRAAAAAAPPEVALESYDSWTSLRFADEAATIATPTLAIAPAEDKPMTPQFVRETVVEIIPGSRLEIVEETSHYVPLEAPERIARSIERFVDSL